MTLPLGQTNLSVRKNAFCGFCRWGVQLSEIQLENSWFERCEPSCAISEELCDADHNLKQYMDPASDFLTITSHSSNIQIDQSNSTKLFNGDTKR